MDYDEIGKICGHLPVLLRIQDEGSLRQRDIRERLGMSRSTAHRKINWLEDEGLVVRADGGYELTSLGRFFTQRLSDCTADLRRATECEEFLETVTQTDLALGVVCEGEVTRATDKNPFQPLTRLAEVTVGAEEARVLTDTMAPQGFEVGRRGVREGDTSLELIVDTDIVETVNVSGWYGDGLEEDLKSGDLRLWLHDDVGYRMGILDETVVLSGDAEDGVPKALLETDDGEAVGWAKDLFERHKEEADRLTLSDM